MTSGCGSWRRSAPSGRHHRSLAPEVQARPRLSTSHDLRTGTYGWEALLACIITHGFTIFNGRVPGFVFTETIALDLVDSQSPTRSQSGRTLVGLVGEKVDVTRHSQTMRAQQRDARFAETVQHDPSRIRRSGPESLVSGRGLLADKAGGKHDEAMRGLPESRVPIVEDQASLRRRRSSRDAARRLCATGWRTSLGRNELRSPRCSRNTG